MRIEVRFLINIWAPLWLASFVSIVKKYANVKYLLMQKTDWLTMTIHSHALCRIKFLHRTRDKVSRTLLAIGSCFIIPGASLIWNCQNKVWCFRTSHVLTVYRLPRLSWTKEIEKRNTGNKFVRFHVNFWNFIFSIDTELNFFVFTLFLSLLHCWPNLWLSQNVFQGLQCFIHNVISTK